VVRSARKLKASLPDGLIVFFFLFSFENDAIAS